MHYWNLLRDWNTLDSVRAVHSFLEASALAFFAFLVLFDVLAHVYDEHPKRSKGFERAGLWFFGVAVLAEILAYPYSRRNDELSEKVIVSLSGLAGEADQKARQALADSSVATEQSADAKTKSGLAIDESGKAKTSASTAMVLAQGARQEADTFEKDIKTARTEAADALANLAEAKRLAEEAQKGTARNTETLGARPRIQVNPHFDLAL